MTIDAPSLAKADVEAALTLTWWQLLLRWRPENV